ncbi:MAG: HAD family hydrolase [Promethearchaeota archaeon]|nr:MAG: HAD family hydrolase [Candidatus Lokiarchaeota archaeon]
MHNMDTLDIERIKGVIFDLDGVIFDIIDSIRQAVHDAVDKYKITVDIEDVLQEIAHLIEDLQNYPVPKIILNSYELLKVKFLNGLTFFKKLRIGIYLFNQFNKYKEDAGIFEGIDVIISGLSENKRLAILTNNKKEHAEDVLEKYNLKQYFESIFGFNEVEEVKPSPDGILKIINQWNLRPSEVIFIGDMTSDVLAGKAAKVKMIAVASGLASKKALEENNPDYIVDNTTELKQLLKLG